ncbi:MAG: four helix bundle protein [Chitinophagaceae bacterium]|nr:MAG: four helix bundle protein [Chitinophagaceae bacterium]
MFLELGHTKKPVYTSARKVVIETYKATKDFPADERFALVQQIRRAATSVHLNIAEGCSRKSEAERKRYFEVSRGSLIEVDAALDVAEDLDYVNKEKVSELGAAIIATFKQLSGLIG